MAWVATSKTDPKTGETTPQWRNYRHTDFLDQKLVELAARDLRREGYIGIIIEEPPRVGKSEHTSHWFPSWYIGTFPDHTIMLASYEADFAATWGRKVRDTTDEWGSKVFGVQVSNSSSAVNHWRLQGRKGGMDTAGVGGSFTGRGANLLIIDDPIKNAKEADSETIRNAHWSWYKTTARTRLEPDGVICVIMTRWHEDDLVGRLKKEMAEDPDADKFLVVRLPMRCEEPDEDFPLPDPLDRRPGELLVPERFGEDDVRPIESRQDRTWFALYQQRPVQVEGALFNPDDIQMIQKKDVPKLAKKVRRWDMAATEEGEGYDPDFTVGCKVGLSPDGDFYILDVRRFRESPGKTERQIKTVAEADGKGTKVTMEQEPGSSGKTVISHYRRRVLRGYAFRGERSTGNKIQRAEVAASHTEQGDVYMVVGSWNSEFKNELRKFPNGSHDDQVDAFSGALDDLTRKGAGKLVTW